MAAFSCVKNQNYIFRTVVNFPVIINSVFPKQITNSNVICNTHIATKWLAATEELLQMAKGNMWPHTLET